LAWPPCYMRRPKRLFQSNWKHFFGLEGTVREQFLKYVSPEIALFLSKAVVVPPQGESAL